MQSNLITKREAAAILGDVSISHINTLLARRILPRVKLGYKLVRIPRDAVDRYIMSRTEVAK